MKQHVTNTYIEMINIDGMRDLHWIVNCAEIRDLSKPQRQRKDYQRKDLFKATASDVSYKSWYIP